MDLSEVALREQVWELFWCSCGLDGFAEKAGKDPRMDHGSACLGKLREAILRREIALRDAAEAELRVLVAQVNDIANDCDEVAGVDVVGPAERRTWLSIAQKLRAAAGRAQGEALQ